MVKYIFKRFIQLIPVLLGITFLVFLLTYFSPGDPAFIKLTSTDVTPTPELLEQVREEMGLNRPFIVQYFDWLKGIVHGDFGMSYKFNKPVYDVIKARLPATFKLAGASLLLMIIIALPLGILSAIYKNRVLDYVIRIISFLGISMPGFWLGLLLMYVFSLKLGVLPVMGDSGFKSIILPSVTLAISMSSKYIRQLRVSILEELSKDYVTGAKSRGLKNRTILYKHVLQNSLISIITLLGLSIGSLLGGTAIVETIFGWPGVGELAIQAISNRDYPLIQGYVVWMTVIYVFVNLLVDISYQFIDPRIALREGN